MLSFPSLSASSGAARGLSRGQRRRLSATASVTPQATMIPAPTQV
jgi:hypothetical protein